MDFHQDYTIPIVSTIPTSFNLAREEKMHQEKTQQLMKRLSEIEKKSIQMRKETERLKKLKDEAKQKVKDNFPHLFMRGLQDNGFANDEDSVMFTEEELEISDTSFSSGDMTRSEGDETASRFGERNRIGQLPRNLHQMSKEVQEVYSKLAASNKFDANLSDSSDLEGSKNLRKRISNLKQSKVAWQAEKMVRHKDQVSNSALGDMLKSFDRQNVITDSLEQRPMPSINAFSPLVRRHFNYRLSCKSPCVRIIKRFFHIAR